MTVSEPGNGDSPWGIINGIGTNLDLTLGSCLKLVRLGEILGVQNIGLGMKAYARNEREIILGSFVCT